jgi:hypothetical protein
MTTSAAATLVPPLALPARSEDRRFASVSSGRPLPMAALIGSRVRSTVYGLAAVADGLISEADNPASKVSKPRRLKSTRHAVPDDRLAEVNQVAATTGNDPALDTLLLRLHIETACRRGGALALRPTDLDPDQCLILLREKGETQRWQPVSPTLMAHLQHHVRERHAPSGERLLRYRDGRPITHRRYDHLWERLGQHLAWVATQQVSTHWLRHTTLTWVEVSDVAFGASFGSITVACVHLGLAALRNLGPDRHTHPVLLIEAIQPPAGGVSSAQSVGIGDSGKVPRPQRPQRIAHNNDPSVMRHWSEPEPRARRRRSSPSSSRSSPDLVGIGGGRRLTGVGAQHRGEVWVRGLGLRVEFRGDEVQLLSGPERQVRFLQAVPVDVAVEG